ncbi:MAG: hypothetical protein FJ091_05155 [Deltaproteobacteria bacterium]|nr:hypothetical protein [Deltaproteobacteria bacterium]
MTRIAALTLALAFAAPALADDHRSDRTGHPLKIIATILHPVGVVVDYVVMRPAHWLAEKEPVKTLTGHEEV